MFSDTLKLRTEQLLRNRLWRHSISVAREDSSKEEIAELLAALIDGLKDQDGVRLEPYVVLPDRSIDRPFFDAIAFAECARFPLAGEFGRGEGTDWRCDPFVFHLADPDLVRLYVDRFWGGGGLAIFFSPLGPVDFFAHVVRLGLIRRERERLVWAPFWQTRSFERFLVSSGARRTDRVFREVGYYLAEGEEGKAVRVYCRGEKK